MGKELKDRILSIGMISVILIAAAAVFSLFVFGRQIKPGSITEECSEWGLEKRKTSSCTGIVFLGPIFGACREEVVACPVCIKKETLVYHRKSDGFLGSGHWKDEAGKDFSWPRKPVADFGCSLSEQLDASP
jgi:hypothetical protein